MSLNFCRLPARKTSPSCGKIKNSKWVIQVLTLKQFKIMGSIFKKTIRFCLYLALTSFILAPASLSAQKMKHGGGGGGKSTGAAKSHASTGARPSTGASKSINGGSQKAPDRKVGSSGGTQNKGKVNTGDKNKNTSGNKTNVGDKNINSGNKTTNIGGGNKVNIDNSKTNVNVNINNSHNTVVRHNNRPYGRPPYVYGGRRYYCYHPYHYHPYRPFYWGPVWHPWGFFIATMAATAIIVSVNNQQYHYDQGVYYVASNGGYTVVQAPVGATITT
ncbi:MAG TPA: DUF6515 family protein, partial [Saprospiraceae bacterium]|nr:DUF6515 family protein [Saprospiraceae bacterium]